MLHFAVISHNLFFSMRIKCPEKVRYLQQQLCLLPVQSSLRCRLLDNKV